jgi:hypothetical protein
MTDRTDTRLLAVGALLLAEWDKIDFNSVAKTT